MIKAPSLSAEWTWIFSGDDALVLPDDAEERERVLKLANETGDWAPLVAPGAQPTLFHLGQVKRTEQDWILGQATGADGQINGLRLQTLTIRMALRRVEGFGPHQVQRKKHAGGFVLAEPDIVNAIQLVNGGTEIINELYAAIMEKANPPRPL